MRPQHRSFYRFAAEMPYHYGAAQQFDRLANVRKSWSLCFAASVAMRGKPDIRQ